MVVALGATAALGVAIAVNLGQIKVVAKPLIATADLVVRGRGGIVIIGDSRASQMQADRLCGERLYRIGFSGEGLSTIAAKAVKIARVAQPRLVLLASGVNDARRDRTFDLVAWERDQQSMADAFRRPGVQVRIVSVIPPAAGGPYGAHLYDVTRIDRMNEALQGVAGFLDVRPVLTGSDRLLRPAFSRDGVHLSPVGEQAWVDVMAQQICAGVTNGA